MPTYQLAWQFSGNTGFGWNEVFYKTADSPAAATITLNLVNRRLLLLDPLNKLRGIKATDVNDARKVSFLPLNHQGLADGSDGPSVAGDAIVCQLGSSDSAKRKIWIRGCPDAYMGRSSATGIDVVTPGVQTKLDNWIAALQSNFYSIRKVVGRGAGGNPLVHIEKFGTWNFTGNLWLVGDVVPTVAKGQRVIISGLSCKSLPGINGRYTVLATDIVNKAIVIGYNYKGPTEKAPTLAGYRLETWAALETISQTFSGFSYFGIRKTRNPTSRSRGSRAATRYRRLPYQATVE